MVALRLMSPVGRDTPKNGMVLVTYLTLLHLSEQLSTTTESNFCTLLLSHLL